MPVWFLCMHHLKFKRWHRSPLPIPELFVKCESSTKLVLPRLCTVRSLKDIEVQWQNLDQLYTLQLLCVRSQIYSEEATKIRLFDSNNGDTIPGDKAIKLIMSTGIVMLQVILTRKDWWWSCKPIYLFSGLEIQYSLCDTFINRHSKHWQNAKRKAHCWTHQTLSAKL